MRSPGRKLRVRQPRPLPIYGCTLSVDDWLHYVELVAVTLQLKSCMITCSVHRTLSLYWKLYGPHNWLCTGLERDRGRSLQSAVPLSWFHPKYVRVELPRRIRWGKRGEIRVVFLTGPRSRLTAETVAGIWFRSSRSPSHLPSRRHLQLDPDRDPPDC
jgi:hypothetical protein